MAFNNTSLESISRKHPEIDKTSISINSLKQKIAFVENELNKLKLPKTKDIATRKPSEFKEPTNTDINTVELKLTQMKKKRVRTKSGDKHFARIESLKSFCTNTSNPRSILSTDEFTRLIKGQVLNEFQLKKRHIEDNTFITTIPYVTYAKKTTPGKVLHEVAEKWLKTSEEFKHPLQTLVQNQKDCLERKSHALERSIEKSFHTCRKKRPKAKLKTLQSSLMENTGTKKQFEEIKIPKQIILHEKPAQEILQEDTQASPRNDPVVIDKLDKDVSPIIVNSLEPEEVHLIRKKVHADNPLFYPGFCEHGDKKPNLFTKLKEQENVKRQIVHVPENPHNSDIITTFSWRMGSDGKLKELKKKNDQQKESKEETSDKENKIHEPLSWRKIPQYKKKEPPPSEPKSQKQRSYNSDEVREYIRKQHMERKRKFSEEKLLIENLRKKKEEALKGLMEIQRKKVASTIRKESKSPKLVLSRKTNSHSVKNDCLRHPSFIISLSTKPIATKRHKTIQTEQLITDIENVISQTQRISTPIQVDPVKENSPDNMPKTSVRLEPSSSTASSETSSSERSKVHDNRSLLNGFQCEVPFQTIQPVEVLTMVDTEMIGSVSEEPYKHQLKDNSEMRIRTPSNLYWGPSGRLPDPYCFMNVLKQKYKIDKIVENGSTNSSSFSNVQSQRPNVSNSLSKSLKSLKDDVVDLATVYASFQSDSPKISDKPEVQSSESDSASSGSEATSISENLLLSLALNKGTTKSNDGPKNSISEDANAILSKHPISNGKSILVKSLNNIDSIELMSIRSLSRRSGENVDIKTDLSSKMNNSSDISENILSEKNSSESNSMVENGVENLSKGSVTRHSNTENQWMSETESSIASQQNTTSPKKNSISGLLRPSQLETTHSNQTKNQLKYTSSPVVVSQDTSTIQSSNSDLLRPSQSESRHSNQVKNRDISLSPTSTKPQHDLISSRNVHQKNVPDWSNMEPEMYHQQLQLGVSCLESLHLLNDVQSLELATLSQQKLGSLNRQLQISLREDDDERHRFFQDIKQKHQEALSRAVSEVKNAILESTLAIMPLTRQQYVPPTYSIGQQTTTSVAQQTSVVNSLSPELLERTISSSFNDELNSKSNVSNASVVNSNEVYKSDFEQEERTKFEQSTKSVASDVSITESAKSYEAVLFKITTKSESSISLEIETAKSVQNVSELVNTVSSAIESLPISYQANDIKTDDSISDIVEVSGIEMPSIHSSSISSVVDDLTPQLNKPSSDLSSNIEEEVENESDTITESIQSIKNSQLELEKTITSGNSSPSKNSSSETLNDASSHKADVNSTICVVSESMKQTKVKMLSPLIPLKAMKKNKDYSTSEDESTQSHHTVIITDQSDLEGRVIALRVQLKKRKSEASRLAREWKRRYRDTLKEKEISLQKQIKAYEDFIEETRRDLEKELDASNQSNTSINFTKPKIISRKSDASSKRLDGMTSSTSKKDIESETSSISSNSEAINESIPSRSGSDVKNNPSEVMEEDYTSDKSESIVESIKSFVSAEEKSIESIISNQESENNYEISENCKQDLISNENIAFAERDDILLSDSGTVPSETPPISGNHFSSEENTSTNDNSNNDEQVEEHIYDSEDKTPSYLEVEEKISTSVQDEEMRTDHDSYKQIHNQNSPVPEVCAIVEVEDAHSMTVQDEDASKLSEHDTGEQVPTQTIEDAGRLSEHNSSKLVPIEMDEINQGLTIPEDSLVLVQENIEESLSSETLVELVQENVESPPRSLDVSKSWIYSTNGRDFEKYSYKSLEGDLVNKKQPSRGVENSDVKIFTGAGDYVDQSLRTEDDVSSISEVPEIVESEDHLEKPNQVQLQEEGAVDQLDKPDIQIPQESPKDISQDQDETVVKSEYEISIRDQEEKDSDLINDNALNALIREQVNACLKIASMKKEKVKLANTVASQIGTETTVEKVTESVLSNIVEDTVECLKSLQNQKVMSVSSTSLDISQRVSDILLCLKKDNSKSPPSKHRPQDLMILSPIDEDQDLFDSKNTLVEDSTIDPVTEIQTDVEWFEEDFGLKSPKSEAGGSPSVDNFTYYFREIPDKPPPPYTPPQGAMLEKLAKIRKTLPSAWKIPNSEEEVDKLLVSSAEQLYNGFINDVPLEELAPDEKYFEMEARFDEITAKSERAYRFLVFDLCKAAIQQLQKSTEESKNQEPWKKIRRTIRNPVIPDNKVEFVHMVQKIAKTALETKIKSGLATKFKHKKHDFVDALLLQDMAEEETQWVNYENDELTVKLFVANSVFAQLVEEVVSIIRNKSCVDFL